jgi:CheY-like chemotaxis protein
MLSGRLPFEADSAIGVLLAVVTGRYEPLTNVPPKLAAVVERCLQKTPADRFGSVAAFAEALSACAADEESTMALPAARPAARALIADDDAVVRRITRALLEEMGYSVDEAVDGSEAIRRLKSGEYAVLITDLLMPRLDGWSVLDFVRGYPSRRPGRVFVTSTMLDVTLGNVDREIVMGVIAKPITRAKLKEVVGV